MYRDIFWNYPYFFSKVIKTTSSLFYILLAFFLGYFVFWSFTSDFALRFVEGRDTKKITEGVVGSLMSSNPMYVTQNSVDRDFYRLVYEKFIDVDEAGDPVASIADEWGKTDDLEYIFKLRNDLVWHDGESLNAEDVVWNFETSIYLANELGEDTYGSALQGVQVEKVDDLTVRFVLEETNATFWEAISVYMIPKHLYEGLSLNNFVMTKRYTNPVGSGIYEVRNISNRGFVLDAFEEHRLEPSIEEYRYVFFNDYDDLNAAVKNNEIDIINTFDLSRVENLEEYPFFDIEDPVLFNRQRVLFFNTRRERFSNSEFRIAISKLVDREGLLEKVGIGGVPAKGPISPKSWAFNDSLNYPGYDVDGAEETLTSLGYSRESDDDYYVTEDGRVLSITLSFFENDINTNLVEALQETFRDGGVLLRLRPLNYDQVMREILPTRDFELLLYEIEVTVDPDQYNLWHSLRIDHPMVNISGYSYSRVDILLERARTNSDRDERKEDYDLFQRYLVDDAPAIFLYHPQIFFIYRNHLNGLDDIGDISSPSDRYESVHEWFWDI